MVVYLQFNSINFEQNLEIFCYLHVFGMQNDYFFVCWLVASSFLFRFLYKFRFQQRARTFSITQLFSNRKQQQITQIKVKQIPNIPLSICNRKFYRHNV